MLVSLINVLSFNCIIILYKHVSLSGLYYIKANGVDTDLAWCELNYQGTGRSYVLIFAATNLYGDTQSWWKGQYLNCTVFENSDGTSHASWTSRT